MNKIFKKVMDLSFTIDFFVKDIAFFPIFSFLSSFRGFS